MLKAEILAAAKEYVASGEIPYLPLAGYQEYLTSGNRLHFEERYFARRRQLAVLALAYELQPAQETKELLEQVIWEVCNEYTWALPAHLPIVEGAFGQGSDCWLDLFAAETAQTIAACYEKMGTEFSLLTQERMLRELERRIFRPFEAHNWEWEEKDNNWSAVVGGSIGMAILAVMPASPRRKRLLKRLEKSLESYLSGFGEDGACVEGVGYWSYGFGYFLYYCEKLRKVTGDDHFLKRAKVKQIAAFPYYVSLGDGAYLPFSDYSQVALASGLVAFCQEYFGVAVPPVPESSLDFDHCYRYAQLEWNLTYHGQSVTETTDTDHYFADSQWWVKKDQGQVFAAKGGHNYESHNHLDVGHFVYGTSEQLFLTDLGAGEYTKEYFQEATRYDFFVNQAQSHSIPQINGVWQQESKEAPLAIKGENQLSFTLSHFYPGSQVEEFERTFTVADKEVTLLDAFQFSQDTNVVLENFITPVKPLIQKNKVLLQGTKNICTLDFETEALQVKRVAYQDHHGQEQEAYLVQAQYQLAQQGTISVKLSLGN